MASLLLKDPLNDRVRKEVPLPIQPILPIGFAFLDNHTPHWQKICQAFLRDGKLHIEDVLIIIQKAKALLDVEENIIHINGAAVVVGDIHGHFHDLAKILEMGGDPKETAYVFLGDYVDRGFYSCEVIILLYAIKICYPSKIILLRGNHETRERKGELNLKSECFRKYNSVVYDCMIKSFDYLPIACIINQSFLTLHGGLSPKIKTIDDILKLERRQEPCDAIRYYFNSVIFYGLTP